jgi:hypothetical protein
LSIADNNAAAIGTPSACYTAAMVRRLRIDASVFFAIMMVPLIVLWVRSYWWWDQLYNPISPSRLIVIESASGRVILELAKGLPGSPWIWQISQELNGAYWGGGDQDWEEANRYRGVGGFAAYATQYISTYRMLYWFPVLASAALVVFPWIRWTNRFSLRTMLIATTLVAAALGLMVWASR